ncbi:hypothetical protein HWHPT5561_05265 [Petrotoga sp. HWH.PT.55.6.1]|jgi:hypothetical protein|uniref:hypothetical protein n=1 Tax=unclassified Petrotoga TaxID=2620614 RepID=UPI000C9FFCF4|nr:MULTISPECIES: hypothetical protein [unclassified Petrotoga]PNR87775.1 hypothetical protein X925_08710 [Petrotoga sp. 9T1HF07.CasAA.8.2]PNR92219.1 hypothetical protein X926_06900 [Petrotoga sp. HWHPT.55.6.3]RPD35865.1 hypothetical protein HWHPT5561_05265 [Petrotoga sp. HWH.PT.55.6.1]
MYDNLLSLILSQNNSFLYDYAKKNNINRFVGTVLYSKNNLVVVGVRNFLFLLENQSTQNFQTGVRVNLNFQDKTHNMDAPIKMKYLGEASKDSIKLSLKFPNFKNIDAVNLKSPNFTETQNIKASVWLAEFSRTLNEQLKKLKFDNLEPHEFTSFKKLTEKIVNSLLKSFKDNLNSVLSPSHSAVKIVDMIRAYISKKDNLDFFSKNEIRLMKELLTLQEEDKNSLLNKYESKTSIKHNIVDKTLNSYLTIKNLSLEIKTPLMFFSIFGMPIFLAIDREYQNNSKNYQQEAMNQKLNLILLTNNFGVIDANIQSFEKEIYISFELENNSAYFKLKTQYLIEKLEEKDYLVKRIDFV